MSAKSGFLEIWNEVYSRTLWGIWALTSLVVALAGPFGTFGAQAFGWRLGYWGVLIAVAILLAITFRTLWRRFLAGKPAWIEDTCVTLSLAFVFGPFVVAFNRYLMGPGAQDGMGVVAAIGCVLVVTVCTIAVRRYLNSVAKEAPAVMNRDRLLKRLPIETNARLARISSDNHHIRIVTNDGEEHRLLMRLRDAVAEVDIEPGLCVHRSHWVAQATILGVGQDGGREVVELACGASLPVGPKYRSNLIKAGVINE